MAGACLCCCSQLAQLGLARAQAERYFCTRSLGRDDLEQPLTRTHDAGTWRRPRDQTAQEAAGDKSCRLAATSRSREAAFIPLAGFELPSLLRYSAVEEEMGFAHAELRTSGPKGRSISALSLTHDGTRPRPNRMKVDLRRQSPLVALYKQIQLDSMPGAPTTDQAARSSPLRMARSSSQLFSAATSPNSKTRLSPRFGITRRRLSCGSLDITEASCAPSPTRSTLQLGQSASPLRYAVDTDGDVHALATHSMPTSMNRQAGCAGFRWSQSSSPGRTEEALCRWR